MKFRLILLALFFLAPSAPAALAQMPPVPPGGEARPAYLLFEVTKVTDQDRFNAYGRAVRPLLEKAGARTFIFERAASVIEGAPEGATTRIVVFEFPSRAALDGFWTSPGYAEVKKLREGAAELRTILLHAPPPLAGAGAPPPGTDGKK